LSAVDVQVPDVDFVLQPGDRAKVLKPKHPLDTKVLPLFLAFAPHPDYLEVRASLQKATAERSLLDRGWLKRLISVQLKVSC